jgi:hypothetical protein
VIFQRGATPVPQNIVWTPFQGEILIQNPQGSGLVKQASAWIHETLRPLHTQGSRALRLQSPIIACRPAPAAACAARVVVEVVGSDGTTPLRAMEGRAELQMSTTINTTALSRAMPHLLHAAITQAIQAPDLRPHPMGEIERLSRKESRKDVRQWMDELKQTQTPAPRRTVLWVALGHVGIKADLTQLEQLMAKGPNEERARTRALRWIRAASEHAGKTPDPHVKSHSGAKGGSL